MMMRRFVCLFIVAFALMVVLHPSSVVSVDRNKFKKCQDSGFCRRNRAYAKQVEKQSPYCILQDASFNPHGGRYTATVKNQVNDKDFDLEITKIEDSIFRVRIDEKAPLKKRYRVKDVLSKSVQSKLETAKPEWGNRPWGRVEIEENPFKIHFLDENGKRLITASEDGLFNIEHLRLAPAASGEDDKDAAKNGEEGEKKGKSKGLYGWFGSSDDDGDASAAEMVLKNTDTMKSIEQPTSWEERFGGDTDPQPNGPQSVGMDFSFWGSSETSRLYGIPEHADSHALRTTREDNGNPLLEPYRMYNLDVFEYELAETMALYGHVPLMYHHSVERTIGVFWLNAAETWIDITEKRDRWQSHWFSESGIVDFFVILGPSPAEAVAQYARLTGFQDLPPMFSIAYHQCRWNYKDTEDVRQVAAGFDEHNIPFDVIWLDIEHTDGKRYFTWDGNKFVRSQEMIDNVASTGRKMVTIVDPHIKKDSNYWVYKEADNQGLWVSKDGQSYEGFCWPGGSMYPDFTEKRVRDWWASNFAYDKYEGSTPALFTWNDMNEPSVFNGPEVTMQKYVKHAGDWEHRDVHNLYGLYVHMATHQGLIDRNPSKNERPFVLSRAFFAGSQKYGAIWTGDNKADWDHLRASVPMLLTLGVSGISFSGADVGGFFGNPSEHLLVRWYQLGAYQPFFRAHAHLDSKRREPWLFGEANTDLIRRAIRDRYALLPLWYTLFFEASTNGKPPMRPLWFEFPRDVGSFDLDSQFMVGDALMVVAVQDAGTRSITVYFPPAQWFDSYTLQRVTSGIATSLDYSVAPHHVPVFQRGGSIVARKERPRRSSTQMVGDPYTLVVAPDNAQAASGLLYLDDGHSFAYTSGQRELRRLEFSQQTLRNVDMKIGSYRTGEVVERIVILDGASFLRPSATITIGGIDRPLEVVEGANGALVVRNPRCSINEEWSIRFV